MTSPIRILLLALVTLSLSLPAFAGEPKWKFGQPPGQQQNGPSPFFTWKKKDKTSGTPAPTPSAPAKPKPAYDWAVLSFKVVAVRTDPASTDTTPFFETMVRNVGTVATPVGQLEFQLVSPSGERSVSAGPEIPPLQPGQSRMIRGAYFGNSYLAYNLRGYSITSAIRGSDGNSFNDELTHSNFQP